MEVNGYKIEPGANLTGGLFGGAELTGANLTGANLKGVYLERADLSGAYLTDTFNSMGKLVPGLYGANLNRTVADRNTRWPEGFDPVAAGVIFE